MNAQQWLQGEVTVLKDDIENLKGLIKGCPQVPTLTAWEGIASRVETACDDLQEELDEFLHYEDDTDLKRTSAFSLTTLGLIESELSCFEATLDTITKQGTVNSGVSKVLNWLRGKLKPLITMIFNRLWRLLSRMLTPDSWTIKGDAGVGLFGLKGNVELSITFK